MLQPMTANHTGAKTNPSTHEFNTLNPKRKAKNPPANAQSHGFL